MKKCFFILIIFILASCSTTKKSEILEHITLEKYDFDDLKQWHKDDFSEMWPAYIKSCKRYEKVPSSNKIKIGDKSIPVSNYKKICNFAYDINPKDNTAIRKFFEKNFEPGKVITKSTDKGLFTGYYEIDLRGSFKKTKLHKYPLYKLPDENLRKKYTREEIEKGALSKKNLELIYVDDPVQLFFLHIQGSGRIHLDHGAIVRVGYAGQNGYPYYAIGKFLGDIGYISKDKVSAESIKSWLRDNPTKADYIMNKNPSYVFFRLIDDENDGPIGGHGVSLTAFRSLAVDRRYIPYGMPLWLETKHPSGAYQTSPEFNKLVIAQDTGGAIKGPIRGDIFFGHGKHAELLASDMKYKGSYYVLIPKT